MNAADFAVTHKADPDWVAAMGDAEVVVLRPGQRGSYAGFPATVLRHSRNGMYEIRVPGGEVCASASEFELAA